MKNPQCKIMKLVLIMDKQFQDMNRLELLDFLGYRWSEFIILANGNIELCGQEIDLESLRDLATEKNEDLKCGRPVQC